MFKILAITAIVFVVLLIVLLTLAASKPNSFRVVRSTSIQAPPEIIFPLINDFQRWPEWSAYEQKDPQMKRTYSGAASGVGAKYAWNGNGHIGEGSMEITEVAAPSLVALRLDFVRPFRCGNVVKFTLTPQHDATTVTWDMQGPQTFLGKVMGLFIDMDRMVGKDFETGLDNLKTVAEK